MGGGKTHVQRIIKPQPLIQPRNLLDLRVREIEIRNLQVLLQPGLIITLWNNRNPPLRGPPQQNLRGGLAVLVGDGLDRRVVE